MPQEFLLEPSRTQIWEGSNMWKQFLELCLQDAFKMNRDALAVSMWCFFWLCLRHARLRSSRDPWEGGGLTVPKENHTWKNFASWFFWHVLAVFSCSGVLETRWKKDRNISEPLKSALHIVQDHKVLRDLTSIRVSSDRSAAICWLQVLSETGGVMQYGANTFLSVRDSFESHWITMTIFQIITLLQN